MTELFNVPMVNGLPDLPTGQKIRATDSEGRVIMLDIGPADVHIDSALSNYAAGYKQFGMIADEVCPIVPVDKASNYFYTWDKDNIFVQAESMESGAGTDRVPEVSPTLSNSTYTTKPYALGTAVATEVQANADAPLNVQLAATRRVMSSLSLGREIRVATKLMTSTNWTGGYVAAAIAKWNGGSGADPIQDMQNLIQGSLTPVNAFAMSERTYFNFVRNAAVQKFIASKTAVKPDLSSEGAASLSAILELPRIIVGRAKKKLTATTYGYVWGDNVVGLYIEPGVPADGQSISTAKTFRWMAGTSPDGAQQGTFYVRTYFDPRRGARGSQVTVVAHNDDEVMTSIYAGGIITGAYA